MEISLGLVEALARFANTQIHRAEISEADQTRAAETLAAQVRENDRLISMLRAQWVRRYGWHPRIECPQKVEECPRNLELSPPIL
jgi:hypothetical protein